MIVAIIIVAENAGCTHTYVYIAQRTGSFIEYIRTLDFPEKPDCLGRRTARQMRKHLQSTIRNLKRIRTDHGET